MGSGRKQTDKVARKALKSYGSIVSLFDKTPFPKKGTDIYCPHFYELKYANGCKFDCQWCFLNGTFRFRENGKAPYLKDTRETRKQLTRALKEITDRTLFNSGEVSDSLVYENELISEVIPIFQDEFHNPHNHQLLILTKSKSIRFMSHARPDAVIVSHSVNAQLVAKGWEHKAPEPYDRLHASRIAAGQGFETRLRIDPMVPVEHWERGYKELVEKIMDSTPHVSVITLGSLRGLQSTINECKKQGKVIRWTGYLTDSTNWGKRIPEEQRIEMYGLVIGLLKDLGYRGSIALCKETLEVWKKLKLDWREAKCNCLL